jgi:hypothetical protein
MKKLLIIQTDEAYFLFETMQVLITHRNALKQFSISLLVSPTALAQLGSVPAQLRILTHDTEVDTGEYDLSVNLSLNEESWELHGKIRARMKLGPYLEESLRVSDLWSAYFLTLKARAPFLTFHLHDVYKNILGIRSRTVGDSAKNSFRAICIGMTRTELFPASEQVAFIEALNRRYPGIPIRDIQELDPHSDQSQLLYIGPAGLDVLQLCATGARSITLCSHFEGFNLLPYREGNLVVSARGRAIQADELLRIVGATLEESPCPDTSLSVYALNHENLYGAYLSALNNSDDNYPIYQSHVVLWNYLLSLFDTNLQVIDCSETQIQQLRSTLETLDRLIRLYDYALSAITSIHSQSKATATSPETIQAEVLKLEEIEALTDQLAQKNSFLRPLIDFYRIRRGQNDGTTLVEQAQHTLLQYNEEHQAQKALAELFSVTLQKNGVSI